MTTTAIPQEKKDKTIEFYDNTASEYFKKRIIDPLFYKEEFLNFENLVRFKKRPDANPQKTRTVIDIGCGTGRDTNFFLKAGYDYIGIDASLEMLRVAHKNNLTAKFQLMDFHKLDFSKSQFDCFWAAASLLHVPKAALPGVMFQLRNIVKLNGIGFISVKEKTGMITEGYESEPMFGSSQRYFAYYEEAEIRSTLLGLGFKTLKIYRKGEDDPERPRWICCFVRKF